MMSWAPWVIASNPEPIHGKRRDLDRQARLEPHVPGAVDRVGRRLQGVAEHGMADVAGGHARALQGVLRRHGAELGRRYVFERAAEAAEAGAHAG